MNLYKIQFNDVGFRTIWADEYFWGENTLIFRRAEGEDRPVMLEVAAWTVKYVEVVRDSDDDDGRRQEARSGRPEATFSDDTRNDASAHDLLLPLVIKDERGKTVAMVEAVRLADMEIEIAVRKGWRVQRNQLMEPRDV